MEENKVPLKCRRQHFALMPQLVKPEEIDIGNNRIDEDERNQTNDVGQRMYGWKLAEISSGRVDLARGQKSERKQDEIEEDGA
jgi:hypothetical protein